MPAAHRLRLRRAALADAEAATRWYSEQAGVAVADGFLAEFERAYRRIARTPGVGSTRWSLMLNIESLQGWRLRRLPYLVFYVEREGAVEVWRVLHAARDISGTLAAGDEPERASGG